jgi:hypothetical protein
MQLLDLTNELLLLVGEGLTDQDFSSLARTSRFLCVLLNDHLYRRAVRPNSHALDFSIENGLESNVTRLLRLTWREHYIMIWRYALGLAV